MKVVSRVGSPIWHSTRWWVSRKGLEQAEHNMSRGWYNSELYYLRQMEGIYAGYILHIVPLLHRVDTKPPRNICECTRGIFHCLAFQCGAHVKCGFDKRTIHDVSSVSG